MSFHLIGSEACRKDPDIIAELDIPYGDSDREKMDIFSRKDTPKGI